MIVHPWLILQVETTCVGATLDYHLQFSAIGMVRVASFARAASAVGPMPMALALRFLSFVLQLTRLSSQHLFMGLQTLSCLGQEVFLCHRQHCSGQVLSESCSVLALERVGAPRTTGPSPRGASDQTSPAGNGPWCTCLATSERLGRLL